MKWHLVKPDPEDLKERKRILSLSDEELANELAKTDTTLEPEAFLKFVQNQVAQADLDEAQRERDEAFNVISSFGGPGPTPQMAAVFYHKADPASSPTTGDDLKEMEADLGRLIKLIELGLDEKEGSSDEDAEFDD